MNRRAWRHAAAWKVQKASVEVGIQDEQRITIRKRWEGQREEDYREKISLRWLSDDKGNHGEEKSLQAIFKMGKNRKGKSKKAWEWHWSWLRRRQNSSEEGEELAAGMQELNQQQQRELGNAWLNTQRHLFMWQEAKPWMFRRRIQKVLRVYMGSKSRKVTEIKIYCKYSSAGPLPLKVAGLQNSSAREGNKIVTADFPANQPERTAKSDREKGRRSPSFQYAAI